jgi:hypothetical protein
MICTRRVDSPQAVSRFRRLMRRSGRLLLAGFCLVLILCLAGAIWEAIASRRGVNAFPPPGRMISVGTHRLHLLCGTGTPTVVFEPGWPGDYSVWPTVYPPVTGIARLRLRPRRHGLQRAGTSAARQHHDCARTPYIAAGCRRARSMRRS